MDSKRFEILAMEFLKGEINQEDRVLFETFLSKNPTYSSDFDMLQSSWSDLDSMEIFEPSEEMDKHFFQMLSSEVKKKEKSNWGEKLQNALSSIFKPQLAYGVLVLVIGLTAGYFLKQDNLNQAIAPKIASTNETEQVRERLVLTLLKQPSANKRLEGVSEANKLGNVDETVIRALLKTLNNDENVNVRLAAIESLTNYIDNPIVRRGLIQSIPNQKSPIVQVTLANLMLALEEKKSIEPFKQLLKEKELDTTVKKKIENTIEAII
ncbi:HEAT repeat domain-containing protein [Croceitalea rosinachiae]|uniref:HEAT repeat domain-containing protein n=1 Tax=Croceitalea rosinachiae TaxID=3075596 RepID=A0ABU3A6D2_9FLAO|nr:HEAT repeat domain-containing protein [Croceitalea sp. F388]MDT0605719.1 HEAT repeat domain-containing protein [Croceitalea sp. F388]